MPIDIRLVGAVDAVAVLAETHPAGAHGVVGAGQDRFAGVVVGGVGDAALDGEGSHGAGRGRLADCDGVDLLYFAVFDEGKLAVFKADYDDALNRCGCWRRRLLRDSGLLR